MFFYCIYMYGYILLLLQMKFSEYKDEYSWINEYKQTLYTICFHVIFNTTFFSVSSSLV